MILHKSIWNALTSKGPFKKCVSCKRREGGFDKCWQTLTKEGRGVNQMLTTAPGCEEVENADNSLKISQQIMQIHSNSSKITNKKMATGGGDFLNADKRWQRWVWGLTIFWLSLTKGGRGVKTTQNLTDSERSLSSEIMETDTVRLVPSSYNFF